MDVLVGGMRTSIRNLYFYICPSPLHLPDTRTHIQLVFDQVLPTVIVQTNIMLLSTLDTIVQKGSYKLSLKSDLVKLITLKGLVYCTKG